MPNITKARTVITLRIDKQAAAEIAFILRAVLSDLEEHDERGKQAIERVRNATDALAAATSFAPEEWTEGGAF